VTDIPCTDETVRDGAEPERDPRFLEPTRERALRVWWSFFWPWLVVSTLFDIASPRVGDWIVAHGYMSAKTLHSAMPLFGIWLSVTLLMGAMDYALSRKYRDFRVALVAKGGDATPLERTFARVGRVTWRGFWWFVLYYVIFGLLFLDYPILVITQSFGLQPGTLEIVRTVLGMFFAAVIGFYVFKHHIIDHAAGDAEVRLLPR
jgi:hypothetical protein